MKHIFHPTDLGHGSTTAFPIALRLAATTKSALTIMHVDGTGEGEVVRPARSAQDLEPLGHAEG
ncbi:MAG: hypothetical protein IPF78_10525 [Flavobacteriales bacterium]|nr:hypothetical protein [Flavobacteriales bacterium]